MSTGRPKKPPRHWLAQRYAEERAREDAEAAASPRQPQVRVDASAPRPEAPSGVASLPESARRGCDREGCLSSAPAQPRRPADSKVACRRPSTEKSIGSSPSTVAKMKKSDFVKL